MGKDSTQLLGQQGETRERLGSRLGFILLSAGCAIGCGNVWKFPWRTANYGGGAFVLIYLICLIVLGLPVMTMEFSIGRRAQASPIKMYQQIEKKGQKWHLHGILCALGALCLMAFYTVVTGWMMYYFVSFLTGNSADLLFAGADAEGNAIGLIYDANVNLIYLVIALVLGFGILCFNLQGGLERVTKVMMVVLLFLMVGLAVYALSQNNAIEGLKYYLVPDFTKFNFDVVVGAMNQAFFTLSLGIGSMAIFGSYLGKDRALKGESVNIIALDTFVALMAGLIIFPSCFSQGLTGDDIGAGPGLLFTTMSNVFNGMGGAGRWVGALFFLFMTFAALSTELAVFEEILANVRELFHIKSRPIGCAICAGIVGIMSVTTALGWTTLAGTQPSWFGDWLSFWDFIVSNNLLPLGSLILTIFCCSRNGWGWKNFLKEANAGEGAKVKDWVKPIYSIVVPICIIVLYIYGIFNNSEGDLNFVPKEKIIEAIGKGGYWAIIAVIGVLIAVAWILLVLRNNMLEKEAVRVRVDTDYDPQFAPDTVSTAVDNKETDQVSSAGETDADQDNQ